MLTKLLIQTLLLLAVPTAVFAKKGGGGGGGWDDDDDDDSSGGSSDGDSCGAQDSFLETFDIVPDYVLDRNASSGGAFFQGEAFFNYRIPKQTSSSSYSNKTNKTESQSIRMLAYAWVGPQFKYPKGWTNPFNLGFKAWESDNPVKNISTSYTKLDSRYCPVEPDLVKFHTTTGVDLRWTRLENVDGTVYTYFPQRAGDMFSLNATESTTDPEAVDIRARYKKEADDLDVNDLEYVLRLSSGQGQEQEWIDIGWSEGITVNGSITNTTLDLYIAGNTTMKAGYQGLNGIDEWDSPINITFSGTFHSANSTEKPSIRQKNQPLVSFESNDGTRVAHLNYAMGMVWIICIALLYGQFL